MTPCCSYVQKHFCHHTLTLRGPPRISTAQASQTSFVRLPSASLRMHILEQCAVVARDGPFTYPSTNAASQTSSSSLLRPDASATVTVR